MIFYQAIIGIVATAIGLSGYIPYFKDIIKRTIKPHAFSWLIWGIIQSVVFFADLAKGAGAGAWPVGAPALLNLIIFVIAIFRGEKEITKIDTASLIFALVGIGVWIITTNPLWSVIIVSIVDAVGYIPTVRKAYKKPHEESVTVYALSGVAFGLSLFALASVSLTTVLYPSVLVVVNLVFVSTVLQRRRALAKFSKRKRRR